MHALSLHNSLTRRQEVFRPLNPAHVRVYCCGPTVYDRAHLGNARPVVVFDVLARLLRALFPKVTYVRNITDVEDKIIARAAELGISIAELTEETTRLYHEDMAEHSICQPGRPRPQGLSQPGVSAADGFHSTKSISPFL